MDSLRRHIGFPSPFALAARAALADADAIIVMLGTNDAMWNTERFREHFVHEMKALNRQLFALRAGSARGSSRCAWLAVPPAVHEFDRHRREWREDNWTASVRGDLPRLVREAAAALHMGVIDVRSLLERDWRRAFGLEEPTSPTGDGVHPPPAGMALIARAVMHELHLSSDPQPHNNSLFVQDHRYKVGDHATQSTATSPF